MNSGRPRAAYFAVDALHRLRRPIVPTVIAVLILFAGTTSIFATTGLAVASQQRTLERINSPEGRLITVTDAQGDAGLSPESVPIVASLSGVEWAVGVGPATDVTNTGIPGGAVVPARAVFGALPPPVTLNHERLLSAGEAVAGPGLAAEVGLGSGVGPVTGRTGEAVVVGDFTAAAPLEALNANLLVAAAPNSSARLLTLWVSVHDVSQLAQVERAIRDSLVADNAGAVRVETSKELALLSADVAAELGRSAQLTITGLLLAVAVLIAAVQFGRVAGVARDIGRGRALGATRSTIVIQLLINAGLCGLIGAGGGIIAGLIINLIVAGAMPGIGFATGVGVLMVIAALIGSVPPAIRAARLDPVRILRVP